MEVTGSMIYWLTRLDGINYVLNGAMLVCLMATIVSAIVTAFIFCFTDPGYRSYDADLKKGKKAFGVVWRLAITTIVFAIAACAVPSTKNMAAIIMVPVIANNEQVQELPNKVLELGNEWLNELKPKKDE